MQADRPPIALVSAHDDAPRVLSALERAGFDVAFGYAPDFRAQTTGFSTFIETYKPSVIIFDLAPPVAEAVKDLLTFKSVAAVEGRTFVFVSSDEETCCGLPENVNAIRLDPDHPEPVLEAVRQALRDRRAA